MSFWENYRKELGIGEIKKKNLMIFIIVLILGGTGILWYQHQEDIDYCKDACSFLSAQKSWLYDPTPGNYMLDNKILETQDQCIDYCLRKK